MLRKKLQFCQKIYFTLLIFSKYTGKYVSSIEQASKCNMLVHLDRKLRL